MVHPSLNTPKNNPKTRMEIPATKPCLDMGLCPV